MPSRATYWLKLTGTLEGQLVGAELTEIERQFRGVFPSNPPDRPGLPGSWPESFRFPDWPDGYKWPPYSVHIWNSSVEIAPFRTLRQGRSLTLLSFYAELGSVRPGNLYQNYDEMKLEIEWFYTYCRQGWYLDMMGQVEKLNDFLFRTGKLRDWVDVRDYCWDCGDGGGE
jgi:hypothetical protein